LLILSINFIAENYWTEKDNRRKFFVDFAKQNGFEPLIAENWYPITRDKITEYRV